MAEWVSENGRETTNKFEMDTEAATHVVGQFKAPVAINETAGLRSELEQWKHRVSIDDARTDQNDGETDLHALAKYLAAQHVIGCEECLLANDSHFVGRRGFYGVGRYWSEVR